MTTPNPVAPPRMSYDEQQRILTAAFYALNLQLGPLGELAARELQTTAEFGHRLGHDAVFSRLTEQLHEMWKAKDEGRRT